MPKSGLSLGEKISIFMKRKGQKRNRKENIVKKNAQGIVLGILSCFLNSLAYENFNIFFIIIDKIWSHKIDGLIKIQISEWQQHFDILDKDGDGNGRISISEFALGHDKILQIIGNQFFDGKKEINFDQYCLYMVLFSDQDACNEINNIRIKKVYNDYCKMQKPFNGRIKTSDFLEQNNDLLTIAQFEEILELMCRGREIENNPGEINYEQFKEFVESMIVFALMDRDNNRSISPREVKLFVKFMGQYRSCDTEAEEVKRFFENQDEDGDGEITIYEFLLVKYRPKLCQVL